MAVHLNNTELIEEAVPPTGQAAVDAPYRDLLNRSGQLYVSAASELGRYTSVLRHLNLDGKIVLDLGCGHGGFIRHLEATKVRPTYYLGLDALPEVVAEAQRRLTQRPVPFLCEFKHYTRYGDENRSCQDRFTCDIALGLGVFDVKFTADENGNQDKIFAILADLFNDAQEAVACTFASTHFEGTPQSHQALVDPCWIYDTFKVFVPRVLIDDSYAPHVFTAIGYKGVTPWKRNYYRDWYRGRVNDLTPAGDQGTGFGGGTSGGE